MGQRPNVHQSFPARRLRASLPLDATNHSWRSKSDFTIDSRQPISTQLIGAPTLSLRVFLHYSPFGSLGVVMQRLGSFYVQRRCSDGRCALVPECVCLQPVILLGRPRWNDPDKGSGDAVGLMNRLTYSKRPRAQKDMHQPSAKPSLLSCISALSGVTGDTCGNAEIILSPESCVPVLHTQTLRPCSIPSCAIRDSENLLAVF
ncbi:hypothetical protein F4679DRAFT_101438 [Xylaria curta]|nr:hypothetical protein F4679DRAFT_101438 [Xylaria curta]